jgi:2-C-methyl-D-erythritol 2,4-cyclodiphosphate synthase
MMRPRSSLEVMATEFRIGHGFDVHRFKRGRKLVLGGVEIAYDRGLVGHSDADAVLHALINAILGALGDGDLGCHFPDSDPRYKNIASSKLLKAVLRIVRRKHFKLVNADVTLVAQRPKLSPHYGRMRKSVASLCDIAESRINIKATTTEKLGWAGAGKGMAATAVVLLSRTR